MSLASELFCSEHWQLSGSKWRFRQVYPGKPGAIDSQSKERSENTSENDTLWSWGSAPKGSVLVDGEVLTDPFNSWKDFNITESGIAQVGVDPFKGYPIYAYKIPRTGETKYFYLDPYTNEPFYVDGYAGADIPVVAKSSNYSLPPVLR